MFCETSISFAAPDFLGSTVMAFIILISDGFFFTYTL